jgi:ubiquitin thioesterase OTU1
MKVQIRLRGPNGQVRLDVEEETTLKDLLELIKEKTEVQRFSLKYGYPLKELDTSASALNSTVADLKLRNETIVVVPHESATANATAQGAQKSADVQPAPKPFTAKSMEPDETVVEWPERGGYLGEFAYGCTAHMSAPNFSKVLRVMPDDNSCMFTSVGGAIPIADPSGILRKEISEYILNHPQEYTKAILGEEPSRYVRRMKEKDTWGGAIELSILSDIYKIQICSVDVKVRTSLGQ